MSAAMPRPPGPATTWWTFAPAPGAPIAEISLTPGRQRMSLAGSAKKANAFSGVVLIEIVRVALGMAGLAPCLGWNRRGELVDPNRRRLELRRARLRVGRVDGEDVRLDVVLEVQGHERQPGAKRRVQPDRHLDRAAPRRDPHPLAVGE